MAENKNKGEGEYSFGNALIISLVICFFLYKGDPSIQESIRVIFANYAEIK